MIPGTFFEWEDQSDIVTPEINTVRTMPMFATVITADKGEEGWTLLSGQDWFDMYAVNNVVDFNRHGQPLLQAAMAINAGAELLCKRVVADDACLANLAVIAQPVTTTAQKQDEDGNPLYIDKTTGKETTDVGDGNEPVIVTTTTVKYTLKSASGCKTQAEIIEAIAQAVATDNESAGDNKYYPLWIFFDNGRGESKKRICITPNYTLSKNYDNYFLYDFTVIESSTYFDTLHFTLNPDTTNNGSNISLQYIINTSSSQLKAYQFANELKEFIDIMTAAVNRESPDVSAVAMDILFGTNKKGAALPGIVIDADAGVNLQIVTGNMLLNGTNGEFGDSPITSENYGDMLAKAFAGYVKKDTTGKFSILTYKDGCYDPIIYNVDRYKIDAILDANYPDVVKRAIEQLVTYREDCFYFRDMGTSCNTMEIIAAKDYDNLHNKFCATYCTYYDVIDPYSYKQITVTIMYSMAQLIVTQFNNGRSLPMAGIKYGFVITDAIQDTVGFTPTICPGLNQKEELLDLRINYATFIGDSLVVESLYTSQEKYTQLSFLNNVLSVQEVIKEIRRKCPALRYSLIDGDDLEKYRKDVEEIIAPFESNFKSLTLTYMQDPYYTENKIFYATLAVQFRDFVQTEYFKIIALGSNADVSTATSNNSSAIATV